MQFKNKLCKMKANLKYKLAESFCRNFALQSRNIAKTILAVFIESNEMTSSWWKNSFNIFCEAKKWKCSNLSRQKSWIAVKLWRDWSQVIASFLEIKTFSSHSLMDCAVKQCIQHAYSRPKKLSSITKNWRECQNILSHFGVSFFKISTFVTFPAI